MICAKRKTRDRLSRRQPRTVAVLVVFILALAVPRALATPQQQAIAAQEHADRGMWLAQRGEFKSAEAELRQAVELDPGSPAFLGALGAVLGMEQKLEESNVYLEKALRFNPDDLATRRNLASNQFQLGQLEAAKENLQRLLKAQPNDPVVRLLMGMVAEELKDYGSAIKFLESAPEQVRERPKSLAALARAYYNTGQREKARNTLGELLGHPAGAEGVFLGGQVAAQANDIETAEGMFRAVWSSYPDLAKLGYNLALAQYRANRIEESLGTLHKLLDAGKKTADIYNLLGWCLYKQGKPKDALNALDQAIELEPSRETNYLDVGMILIELNRPTGAVAAAEKAVEVAPNSYQGYRLKGLAETKLGRITEAEKSFARAIDLNPEDPESVLGLASAQWDDGKIQEAETTFLKGIERFPRDPTLHQEYGKMLLKIARGRDAALESRAISLLETAITLDSSLAEPHYQLGNLALTKGSNQEALQELKAAAQCDPRSAKIHYALARAYRRLGRSEEASKEFQLYERLKAEEEKSRPDVAPSARARTLPEDQPTPSAAPPGSKPD